MALVSGRRVTTWGALAAAARNSEDLNVVTSPEVAEAYAAHCRRGTRFRRGEVRGGVGLVWAIGA